MWALRIEQLDVAGVDPTLLGEAGFDFEKIPLAIVHEQFRPVGGLERFRRFLQRPVSDNGLCLDDKCAAVREVIRRSQGQQECGGQCAQCGEPNPRRVPLERSRL
jgi:hypothetical protein